MKRPINLLWDADMGWIIEQYIQGEWEVQNLPHPGKKNNKIPWSQAIKLANKLNTTIRFYPNDSGENTGNARAAYGMFYDEKIEEDQVYYRTKPYGAWHEMSTIDTISRYQKVKAKKEELQQALWETQDQLERVQDKLETARERSLQLSSQLKHLVP